jgi:hypothetical protein
VFGDDSGLHCCKYATVKNISSLQMALTCTAYSKEMESGKKKGKQQQF